MAGNYDMLYRQSRELAAELVLPVRPLEPEAYGARRDELLGLLDKVLHTEEG